MDNSFYFNPGEGGAYSTNGMSLVGLAIAGLQNKKFLYDVDQRELAWGKHLYPDDHTHFPTRGTCLEQVDDPSKMARQYFSDQPASVQTG